MKGNEPKIIIITHDPLVSEKLGVNQSSASRCLVASHIETPTNPVKSAESAKICQSLDAKQRSTTFELTWPQLKLLLKGPEC